MTRNKKKATAAPPVIKEPVAHVPKWQWIVIAIIPFLIYFNTFNNDYALDDAIVITENQFTKQGFAGIDDILSKETFVGYFGVQKSLVAGGRYRPLSLVTFAIEYELFGANPFVSHFVNVLLYALTGIVILFLFYQLFSLPQLRPLQNVVPFLTALLFLVHPVHTEAVANIKGRDEIMGLLLALTAVYFLFRYIKSKTFFDMALAVASFFLALLSKENAYTFVAVVPVLLYIFTNQSNKKIAVYSLIFFGVAVVGLIIRQSVIGGLEVASNQELMNDPFVAATISQKFATITYTLGKYLQLMIFPYPLLHDYYPYHIPLMSWGDLLVILSFLIYLVLGIYAVYGIIKKKIPAFGVFFYLVTLSIVSNIVFPVGTFMSERFIFMPSLGLCLVAGYYLADFKNFILQPFKTKIASYIAINSTSPGNWFSDLYRENNLGLILLLVLVIPFSILTILRNPAWKNNEALFLTDISKAPNSAKLNNAAGGVLYDKAQSTENISEKNQYLEQSFGYLTKAVQIYPQYDAAWTTLGNIYYLLYNDIEKAVQSYTNAGDAKAFNNLLIISKEAANKGNFDIAMQGFNALLSTMEYQDEAMVQIGLIYAKRDNNLDKAIEMFNNAIAVDPSNAEAYENLGVAYAFKGNPQLAVNNFEKALQYNPDDPNLNRNAGQAHQQLGNTDRANYYFSRANSLQQNNPGL